MVTKLCQNHSSIRQKNAQRKFIRRKNGNKKLSLIWTKCVNRKYNYSWFPLTFDTFRSFVGDKNDNSFL